MFFAGSIRSDRVGAVEIGMKMRFVRVLTSPCSAAASAAFENSIGFIFNGRDRDVLSSFGLRWRICAAGGGSSCLTETYAIGTTMTTTKI